MVEVDAISMAIRIAALAAADGALALVSSSSIAAETAGADGRLKQSKGGESNRTDSAVDRYR